MDELMTWTTTVSTLYFTLKPAQTKGQPPAPAAPMCNSIDMVIASNT